ncbi:MAG: bifunctional phosphoserine phosphatase/homoserine phosphotransferase ThrH [Candidatus Bathyarchaeota archaeon]
MYIVCSDLESVLIPEIWVAVSAATGIPELQVTTRDIPDYKVLMKQRLQILSTHNLTLPTIHHIIETIKPFEGAPTFLNWLRAHFPTIILTDSFYEFLTPLMEKLGYPTIFCNSLEIDNRGFITNYHLRQPDGKVNAIQALKSLNFQIIAIGDSYNDIDMLRAADIGILFKPSKNIQQGFPELPMVSSYSELQTHLQPLLSPHP